MLTDDFQAIGIPWLMLKSLIRQLFSKINAFCYTIYAFSFQQRNIFSRMSVELFTASHVLYTRVKHHLPSIRQTGHTTHVSLPTVYRYYLPYIWVLTIVLNTVDLLSTIFVVIPNFPPVSSAITVSTSLSYVPAYTATHHHIMYIFQILFFLD
jgi:hypothetical protein